ncbi:MAG: hypothetical protein ABI461_19370 [Polyangiaceae bacterium]
MRAVLLVVSIVFSLSCGSEPEKEAPPSCVTFQCEGDSSGWTNCYQACGACIDIPRAIVDKRDVCSF